MVDEALAWPSPPTLTDNVDGTQSYTMGLAFTVASDQTCDGIQWRVPDTVSPPSGDVHAAILWEDVTGTRLGYKEFTPVTGDYQNILFDTPADLPAGQYVACVYTLHYVFHSGSPAGIATPSGSATVVEGRLATFSSGASIAPRPTDIANSQFYVSPLIATVNATPTVSPNGIAVPAVVGAPALSQAHTVSPNGLAVTVALGAPSISFDSTPRISLDGIAVPVALGAPSVSGPRYTPPEQVGNWESLLGVLESARADARRDAERRRHPIDCPEHGWPLQRVRDGVYHCQFGGHTVRGG